MSALGVKFGSPGPQLDSLLYPQEQTSPAGPVRSEKCHKATSRLNQVRAGRLRQKRLIVPLDQFESDPLGTLEEPQLSADVVHLVAQHGYAVGDEVRSGRLNVVDAERKVIEA
jgi:hypothetical protein